MGMNRGLERNLPVWVLVLYRAVIYPGNGPGLVASIFLFVLIIVGAMSPRHYCTHCFTLSE